MYQPVSIIGAAWGLGALDGGCADGPADLHQRGLIGALKARGIDAEWAMNIAPESGTGVATLARLCTLLSFAVEKVHAKARVPIVLGGDHSCAIGTWRG